MPLPCKPSAGLLAKSTATTAASSNKPPSKQAMAALVLTSLAIHLLKGAVIDSNLVAKVAGNNSLTTQTLTTEKNNWGQCELVDKRQAVRKRGSLQGWRNLKE